MQDVEDLCINAFSFLPIVEIRLCGTFSECDVAVVSTQRRPLRWDVDVCMLISRKEKCKGTSGLRNQCGAALCAAGPQEPITGRGRHLLTNSRGPLPPRAAAAGGLCFLAF